MPQYNLTFWQKLNLIPLRIMWLMYAGDDRKSWHLVKKGMEKHKCEFTIPHYESGYKFLKCNHEGCNVCNPVEETFEEMLERRKERLKKLEAFLYQQQNGR